VAVKALIKVGYACNQRCVFCHAADRRARPAPATSVEAKIARAAALGCDTLVFSGGEPTIHRELPRWARLVSARGLALGLVTNGRMLAYPEVARQLCARGLAYVQLSLHGGSAAVHDRQVGVAGFAESLAALEQLSGRGLALTVNCVVTTIKLEHLDELVELLEPLPDVRLKFSMVERGHPTRPRP
jgi:MoaA/NifB/PqqE/SkfB family radical SAM enzyme